MAIPENMDREKLAETALALLSLSSWDEEFGSRAWKSLDWDLLDILHQKGWIGNPVGKQKSVDITAKGAELAETFLEKHYGK